MLLDSNIIIYSAKLEYQSIRDLIIENIPYVSVVSYIEVLGYNKLSKIQKDYFEEFFQTANMLPISNTIIKTSANLKQEKKMSLGDAIIAATALQHNLTLITHNVKDFEWIDGLSVFDPLST